MDKIIGVSELRKSIASIIQDVHEKGARYIVMQHSRAKAVLLRPDELETLEAAAGRGTSRDFDAAEEDVGKKQLTSYEKFFGKSWTSL
jgi:PHD/YefM family antitoxin component YafN of YafNO toxin-antitoxin module